MITLAGLIRTFLATRALFTILPMRLSRKRMPITFRNGLTYQLTWTEFRILRDNYSLMQKYAIKQVGDNLFEIQDGELTLIGSSHALLVVEAMENGMYYGIPAHNFLGWFAVSLAIFFSIRGPVVKNAWAQATGLSIILFFTALSWIYGLILPGIIGILLCGLHILVAVKEHRGRIYSRVFLSNSS